MKSRFTLTCFLFVSLIVRAQPNNIPFHTTDPGSGWIPFELYNNQLYFPVMINGHSAIAMLVNGTGSRIDRNFADSLGLLPKAEVQPAEKVTVDIQLAGVALKDIHPLLMGPRRSGHRRDLLLGDELFEKFTVDIDFAGKRVAFYHPAGIQPTAGAVKLALSRTGESRSLPISVESGSPMLYQVYLGDPAAMAIYDAYSKTHGLLQERPVSVRLGAGGGKYPREAIATLSTVTFAGVVLGKVPATFPDDSVSGPQPAGVAGHIGMSMLSRFHLIFDYANDLLYVTPYEGVAGKSFAKDNSGLYLVEKQGSYVVEYVSPRSPAWQAGLTAGDTIVLIDQRPVPATQGEAWQSPGWGSLRLTDPGVTYSFLLKGGVTRKLKTATFF